MTRALANGRAAFDRESWSEAYALLNAADQAAALEPVDLDRLATSAYLTGHDREAEAARSRAHEAYLAHGDHVSAARSAFWLAFAILDVPGQQARAGGWLARAKRLIDQAGQPCAEHGLLLCASAFQRLLDGQLDDALSAFREAGDLGTRFGDPDLRALAWHGEGRILIRRGQAADGLTLLDEVMVSASRHETSPIVTGLVYCGVISACHELFDWRRAGEWTEALTSWCDAHPDMVPFRGACLVRRSEVLQWHGAWDDAIAEARRASNWVAAREGGADVALAQYQVGELCRLRGDFGGAERAYRQASLAGGRVQPGLALLRLAQGDREAAAAAILRAWDETRVGRARTLVLRAAVEILLAAGDVDRAGAAARELAGRADDADTPCVRAMTAAALGDVRLTSGDAAGALEQLREAATAWQAIDAPYELARTRTLIGRACEALGDRDGAALEFDAAQETFDRLGARTAAAEVAALAEPARTPRPGGLTGREVEVLRLVAAGHTNRAIAAELNISEKTVARHLSNIFTKLDLSSRAAATAYAYEHKLV